MAVAAPAQPSVADIISAGMKYGPNAGLAIQRSQYLANALQALQADSGSIRTPLSLGANLLADGITQWGKNRADKEAMTAYSTGMAAHDADIIKGLQPPPDAAVPSPPQAAPSPDPAGPAIAPPAVAATPPVQIGGPPQGPAIPVAANSNALSPADQLKVAQMVWGEARGEPPQGQQAVAAVALNRLKKQPGAAIADILDAPNQFEGYTPKAKSQTSDKLASILANIQPELNGADPTGGATNFYAPALQARLGRQPPSFAVGPGQTFGHQQFFGGDPQAAQQAASTAAAPREAPPGVMAVGGNQQGNPGASALPGAVAMQSAPDPNLAAGAQPFPPPPPAPLPQAGAAPPPAMSSPQAGAAGPPGAPDPQGAPTMPPGPQAAPQFPQHPPTGLPPNPAEMAHLRNLLGSPMTHEEGVAYGESLQRRMVTPIALKPGEYWGPDGQAHSTEQFKDQPGSPNATIQRSTLDNHITSTPNAAYGAVAGGMVMGPGGHVSPVPVDQKARYRIPGAPGFYVTGADGNPTKVAEDNYTVKDVGQTMQELTSSQQYDKAAKLTEMYRGAVQAATRPGGISDAELKDNAAQIFSGGVARQFNAKMLDEGQGPWLRLKQFFPDIASGQKLSPESRQAMVQAMHDYAVEAQGAFAGLAQSKSAYAHQNGVDLAPFISPLMKSLPGVPLLGTIPTGIGGYGAGTGPVAPTAAPMITLPTGQKVTRAHLEAHARANGWIK